MNLPLTSHSLGTITYFLSHPDPVLLLLSGMHGNESEVAQCVQEYVEKNTETIPDFLYIPQVSPSAVTQKTRENKFGHDVNRYFFDPPTDPEVKDVLSIIADRTFALTIDFHEDPDLTDATYLYDSGQLSELELLLYQKYVLSTGAKLHTGIDDPIDTNLGFHVEKGYISTPPGSFPASAGFSGEWLTAHKVTKRFFTVEIPGQAPHPLKAALVSKLFSFLLNLRLS